MSVEHVVLDASAFIDVALGEAAGAAVQARIELALVHAPGHLDAEALSGLGRLHRAGRLSAPIVARQLEALAAAPITRHPVAELLAGAWSRRDRIRLADALYVELADRLGVRLITTDLALARSTPIAEAVTA